MSSEPSKPHALSDEQIANVRKWIEALRSGKYKQGKEFLCRVDGAGRHHCCLGVACEIHGLNQAVSEVVFFGSGSEIDSVLLPMSAKKLLGLRTDDGHLKKDWNSHTSLVQANDGGVPFSKIADFIERELLTNKHRLFITEAGQSARE